MLLKEGWHYSTKYGIEVCMAADSSNGYVANFSIYLGKESDEPRTHGLGYDVVMAMVEPFLNKHRHVFCDNFFTSPKLFDDLFKENTYACGTVRTNRKEMPASASTKEKLKTRGESRGQLRYTKWHDKKDVSLLSTSVSPGEPSRLVPRRVKGQEITNEKPRVADVYIKHMGGVDRVTLFLPHGMAIQKWYRYIFWFLFNLSVCNARVLESFYNGNKKRKRCL